MNARILYRLPNVATAIIAQAYSRDIHIEKVACTYSYWNLENYVRSGACPQAGSTTRQVISGLVEIGVFDTKQEASDLIEHYRNLKLRENKSRRDVLNELADMILTESAQAPQLPRRNTIKRILQKATS